MSNSGWKATIQSGNAEVDLQMLDRHRSSAQQQGLVLHSRNLQTGGFEVEATAPGAPDPFAAQATPYAHSAPPYTPVAGYGPPPAPAMGYGPPVPAPRVVEWAPAASAGQGYSCQACGRDAQVKRVTFMQNIGLLVMRLPKTIRGNLCKHCIDKYFFEMTAITLFFGWWGVISFVYTLFVLPSNLYNYLGAWSLPAPPDDLRSLDAKKTRAVFLIVGGALAGLFAAFWTVASISLLFSDDDDVDSGVVGLIFSLLVFGLPSLIALIVGIVKRVRAGNKAAELAAQGAF